MENSAEGSADDASVGGGENARSGGGGDARGVPVGVARGVVSGVASAEGGEGCGVVLGVGELLVIGDMGKTKADGPELRLVEGAWEAGVGAGQLEVY